MVGSAEGSYLIDRRQPANLCVKVALPCRLPPGVRGDRTGRLPVKA